MKRVVLLSAFAGVAAALLPVQVSATPADLAVIERECPLRLKLPPSGCACVMKKVVGLTDNQQAWVAALMAQDKAAKQKAAKAMPKEELEAVNKLVDTQRDACKGV